MDMLVFDSDATVRARFNAEVPGVVITYFDGHVSSQALVDNVDAEIISLFVSSSLSKECIDLLPQLKLILARSTGFDHIDTAYAASRGITVATVPHYGAHTVAEFTFALLLSLSRRIPEAVTRVRGNHDFSTSRLEGFDLFGKTIGIIGTGKIGRAVAQIAGGFGMEIRMFDLFPDLSIETPHARYVSFDELLTRSDIITLHAPYTKENRHLLNAEAFAKMKRGVVILNTARGELIDTAAFVAALRSGQVAGAGLDVLEGERDLKDAAALARDRSSPDAMQILSDDEALLAMPHVLITPHVAFSSHEAYAEIIGTSVANVVSYLQGAPQNVLHG